MESDQSKQPLDSLSALDSTPQATRLAPDPKDYKLGIGGRILGTVSNFLAGMNGRGPVTYTGKGAMKSGYYRDPTRSQNRPGTKPAQGTSQPPAGSAQPTPMQPTSLEESLRLPLNVPFNG